MRLPCRIRDVVTGQLVSGCVRPVEHSDKVLWSRWHAHMPHDAEDAHWDWDAFIDDALAMPDRFAGFALVAGSELEGLRLLEVTDGPASTAIQTYGTHAMLLSTAPWNRPPRPRFRGVGSILVAIAILRSLGDGHFGKIHCESLPGAEHFHRANGMIEYGTPVFGMKRFRFDASAAEAFVRRVVSEGLLPAAVAP